MFGWAASLLFFMTFLLLMLIVHITYRIKTNKYTSNWLDFVVVEDHGEQKKKRIGKYYYPAILVNVIIAFIVSQVFT